MANPKNGTPKKNATPFKKGARVVMIIRGAGSKSATIGWTVTKVTAKGVSIENDHGASSLLFDGQTGMEIEPGLPGWHAEIIPVES